LLLGLPFVLSLVMRCETVVFADKACTPKHPRVTVADGAFVAELRCAPAKAEQLSASRGPTDTGGFCGTSALMSRMAAEAAAADVEPGLHQDVDLMPVRLVLALIAALGAWLALGALGDRGALIVIDRQKRVMHVQSREVDSMIAFGDRPALVARDGQFYLHASKAEPIVVATSQTASAHVERLRAALRTLERATAT
jgi:hypothetical protein